MKISKTNAKKWKFFKILPKICQKVILEKFWKFLNIIFFFLEIVKFANRFMKNVKNQKNFPETINFANVSEKLSKIKTFPKQLSFFRNFIFNLTFFCRFLTCSTRFWPDWKPSFHIPKWVKSNPNVLENRYLNDL